MSREYAIAFPSFLNPIPHSPVNNTARTTERWSTCHQLTDATSRHCRQARCGHTLAASAIQDLVVQSAIWRIARPDQHCRWMSQACYLQSSTNLIHHFVHCVRLPSYAAGHTWAPTAATTEPSKNMSYCLLSCENCRSHTTLKSNGRANLETRLRAIS